MDEQDRALIELGLLQQGDERVILSLTPVQAWVVMSNIQLAIRHPGNTGSTAQIAEDVARQIQRLIAPPGSAMGAVAEAGWVRTKGDSEDARRPKKKKGR